MTLKMRPEHRKHIADAIAGHDTSFHRARYAAEELSDKRYRWDLLRHTVLLSWVCSELYPYLNDDHIDSALKSLVKPLERAVVGA